MADDCIFCGIVKNNSREFEYETDLVAVFKSNQPEAPIHLLIVPKKHVGNVLEATDKMWMDVKHVAGRLAEKYKVSGFRLVNNFGAAAAVKHMHVHFMAEVGPDRAL